MLLKGNELCSLSTMALLCVAVWNSGLETTGNDRLWVGVTVTINSVMHYICFCGHFI